MSSLRLSVACFKQPGQNTLIKKGGSDVPIYHLGRQAQALRRDGIGGDATSDSWANASDTGSEVRRRSKNLVSSY